MFQRYFLIGIYLSCFHIKIVLKKDRGQGTSKIHIKPHRRVREITRKREMERYIIKENSDKFYKTEGRCPLLIKGIICDLGLIGDGPQVDNVLNGTYTPPEGTSYATNSHCHCDGSLE